MPPICRKGPLCTHLPRAHLYVLLQELRDSFQAVAQAAAEAAYFSGQEAQGGVLAHLAAKLAAKLKVRAAAAVVRARSNIVGVLRRQIPRSWVVD